MMPRFRTSGLGCLVLNKENKPMFLRPKQFSTADRVRLTCGWACIRGSGRNLFACDGVRCGVLPEQLKGFVWRSLIKFLTLRSIR